MANVTFGEVDWNSDLGFNGGNTEKKTANKDLWLRLEEGSNVVRLVTQPHQYITHKSVKKVGDKGFGQKVGCSTVHGSCPLCEKGLKAGPRWLLGVIDRKTNTFKILDISYQVFSQIRKYARNVAVWGDPQKYDIDIVVDKNGGPTGYYAVQPIPHKPLSAADQKIKDDADVEELKRKVTAPSPEIVQKRLDKILGDGGELYIPAAKGAPGKPATAGKPGKAAPVEMTDEEDISDIFPDYNGGTNG